MSPSTTLCRRSVESFSLRERALSSSGASCFPATRCGVGSGSIASVALDDAAPLAGRETPVAAVAMVCVISAAGSAVGSRSFSTAHTALSGRVGRALSKFLQRRNNCMPPLGIRGHDLQAFSQSTEAMASVWRVFSGSSSSSVYHAS